MMNGEALWEAMMENMEYKDKRDVLVFRNKQEAIDAIKYRVEIILWKGEGDVKWERSWSC